MSKNTNLIIPKLAVQPNLLVSYFCNTPFSGLLIVKRVNIKTARITRPSCTAIVRQIRYRTTELSLLGLKASSEHMKCIEAGSENAKLEKKI